MVDLLGAGLGIGLTVAIVMGVLALPLRWAKWVPLLIVPGLPWLISMSAHNGISGDPGRTDWRIFALYVGVGLCLSVPHILRFWGREPIWLALGLGQATMLLLLAIITFVDWLSLAILQSRGIAILETRNVWSVLFDLVLPVPLIMGFATPLALLAAIGLAWRRRSVGH